MTRDELVEVVAAWIRTGYSLDVPIPDVADTIIESLEKSAGIPVSDILSGRKVVVPVEPTHAMYEVFRNQDYSYVHAKKDCWQALLSAAKDKP